jgi:ribosomal protein S18 acetylase RimI-like enzyme
MTGMRQATEADVTAIHQLRLAAEQWLAERGIVQWRPGRAPRDLIERQVARGEWQVAAADGTVQGCLRLLRADQETWPDDGVRAVYVHGLMIDRDCAGSGLGARLLEWAAAAGAETGATAVRLDCVETNDRLRRYYRDQGFREVGWREHEDRTRHVLLEKPLEAR